LVIRRWTVTTKRTHDDVPVPTVFAEGVPMRSRRVSDVSHTKPDSDKISEEDEDVMVQDDSDFVLESEGEEEKEYESEVESRPEVFLITY
jgi:hypothetical protein